MREEVIKRIRTDHRRRKREFYLEKSRKVVWDIYSSEDKFEVDAKRLIRQGEYLSVRKHCRFLLIFPEHGHNYIEIFIRLSGGRSQTGSKGERIVMEVGDILFFE